MIESFGHETSARRKSNFRATDELDGCRDEITYAYYCPIEI